jgi:hypothetical protein
MNLKLTFTAFILVGLTACNYKSQESSQLVSPYLPTASVQEIMASIVDTNADNVWEPVATIITKSGIEEKAPKTPEEWADIRRHAIVLAEAGNLLVIPGRKVAAPGASTSAVPAELTAEQIQKTIDEHHQDFVARAQAFHTAVQQAITAIDAKNTEELVKAGSGIDKACEACHIQFWYPIKK